MDRTKLIEKIIQAQQQIIHEEREDAPVSWMDLNLTIGQLKSLFFIDFEGSTNFKNLANVLGVTPPNVTGIIDRLVEQGLVSREENLEDRRMFLLKATEKGKALLTKLRESRKIYASSILAQLKLEELSALAQGLTALAKAAEHNKEKHKNEHHRS